MTDTNLIDCNKCNGTGFHNTTSTTASHSSAGPTVSKSASDAQECPRCAGRGTEYDTDGCPRCGADSSALMSAYTPDGGYEDSCSQCTWTESNEDSDTAI